VVVDVLVVVEVQELVAEHAAEHGEHGEHEPRDNEQIGALPCARARGSRREGALGARDTRGPLGARRAAFRGSRSAQRAIAGWRGHGDGAARIAPGAPALLQPRAPHERRKDPSRVQHDSPSRRIPPRRARTLATLLTALLAAAAIAAGCGKNPTGTGDVSG